MQIFHDFLIISVGVPVASIEEGSRIMLEKGMGEFPHAHGPSLFGFGGVGGERGLCTGQAGRAV